MSSVPMSFSLVPNWPQHPTAARFARTRRVSGKSRYTEEG
jgi:hypothetical protein